ncbi:hypothetical protein MPDQ_006256 [Monascus purpureus]|uniref:Uncharacterized protein n=1 Tax=Monascus purpureus TaxID=5098 RepID=A0A507QX82_MONPU|nr:hypothetical protein MPDQ_006256 [Monascus purpureus]
MPRDASPKNISTLARSPPSTSTPPRVSTAPRDDSGTRKSPTEKKRTSPNQNGASVPKVFVKKEPPPSPAMHTRPRPRKLDLSASLPNSGGLSARPPGGPMTAREGVSMQDVGFACLSPGFQTHDPVMREQLQRSLSVRDQQRSIIEARLHKTSKDDGSNAVRPSDSNPFGPSKSSKRRPPGLSIVPPSASQFANERVIQSAPLNRTFTGRYQMQPLPRHPANESPMLTSQPHIQHVPANQTNNRLPPLSDVFGSDTLGPPDRDRDVGRSSYYPANSATNSSHAKNMRPPVSPGLPGNTSQIPERSREYRSAEEAVHDLSGGREELLPRIVHYGGHLPTTPPSPHAVNIAVPQRGNESAPSASMQGQSILPRSEGSARRRPRSEYEMDNGSPPLGHGPDPRYRPNPAFSSGHNTFHGPFGAGRDSPETQRRKKEEFLSLCSRAWDLFHS